MGVQLEAAGTAEAVAVSAPICPPASVVDLYRIEMISATKQ
jgi:hypothetical protein